MKKLRKGFTIVELVIVIAVIAVLTAILIPTFVHLSKKAKVASDQSLVTNLNTALKMEEGETGKKPETMHDAVQGLLHQGYYVPQLVTRSDEELVYNIADNKFSLSSSVQSGKESEYWHIQSNATNPKGWSIYAFQWASTEAGTASDPLHSGFDAGEVSGIESVYYGGGNDALIRTNGGTLTVDAPLNEVVHYGFAEKIDIRAVKAASYTENGIVPFINIKTGNLKLTSDSEVQVIHIEKNERSSTADPSTPDTYAQVIVTLSSDAEMPVFTRDETVIDQDNGTKVCTIVTDQAKDVYLFQNGIYEQIKVADQGSSELTWIDASDANSDTSNAAVQLANNWTGESAPVWTDSETRTLSNDDIENNVEENGMSEKQASNLSKFAGGKGTQADPYLISQPTHWNTVYEVLHDAAVNDKGVQYFKLMADVDFADFTIDNSPIREDETVMPYIDGNGFAMSNISSFTWKKTLFNNVRNFTLVNATLSFNINYDSSSAVYCGAIANCIYGTCLFENVVTLGDLRAFCGGGFLSVYADQQYGSVTFRNVTNYTNMNTTSDYANPFGAHCMTTASPIVFENCKNFGTIIGKNASGFVGMDGSSPNAHFIFADEFAVVNYGKIYGSTSSGHFSYGDKGATKTVNGVTANIKGVNASLHTIGAITINIPEEGNISIPAVANAAKYSVALNISTQYYEDRWSGWGGNYPIGIAKEYSASQVQEGTLSFGFGKMFACESNNSKIHSVSEEAVEYEGIFYEALNIDSLSSSNFFMGSKESLLSVISVNSKLFLYANNDEYRGLLNKDQIADPSKTAWVNITVTAFDNDDVILASGTATYYFTVEAARAFFAD